MKLATFTAGGASEIGVVGDKGVLSLSRVAPRLGRNMIELIARWEQVESEVRKLVASRSPLLPMREVRLQAPIFRPGKILADARCAVSEPGASEGEGLAALRRASRSRHGAVQG